MAEKKLYCGLDLIKFICSLLVVAIHLEPLASVGPESSYFFTNIFARIAVPFFFAGSGFLFFRKTTYDSFQPSMGLRYAGRMIALLAGWTILCFPLVYWETIKNHPRGTMAGFGVWLKEFIMIGGNSHLWYLHSAAVAVLLLTVCLWLKWSLRSILGVGLGLYLVGLTAQTYTVFLRPLEGCPVLWNVLKWVEA